MDCQPPTYSMVYNWLNNNRTCLLCDLPARSLVPICSACEGDLPWLDERCTVCALPLAMAGFTCGQCLRRRPAFRRVEAPWHYGYPLDSLISQFKHAGRWPVGHLLAQLLAQWLAHRYSEGLPRPDCLLAVPMGSKRLRQRGFNQAAMLAQWLGRTLALPHHDNWLLRPHDTLAQQQLGARARKLNLLQAFALAPLAAVNGLHIALVDDVMTTGATAQALALLLRQAGARRVDVYCLARTGKPGQP